MEEVLFLKPLHRGWDRTWEHIKTKFGSYDCKDSYTESCWEYIGTVFPGDELPYHEFKHCSYKGIRIVEKINLIEDDFKRKTNV